MGVLLVQPFFLAVLGLLVRGWEQMAVLVCVQVVLVLFRALLLNPKSQLLLSTEEGGDHSL